jgi:hypothetical protein
MGNVIIRDGTATGSLDEAQPSDAFDRIIAVAIRGAIGSQEADVLVVANDLAQQTRLPGSGSKVRGSVSKAFHCLKGVPAAGNSRAFEAP